MSNSITQKLKYKQSVIKFSFKYGVTNAARNFGENRRTIYRWIKRYDGTLESLKDKSHRPKHHPNEHTEEENKLIKQYKANNKDTGIVVLWVKLRRAGYKRTIQGLYHAMQRLGVYSKIPSKKKKKESIEYFVATYPGERIQIDVKYVPRNCMSKELQEREEKFYQYTAIDEYTRLRYMWYTNEHSTYESAKFLEKVVKVFPFKIECVQTDNGFEFTNRLSWNTFMKNKTTAYEMKLKELGIKQKLTKPHTPKQNGKVERSHRKDQERFYYKKVFCSLEDLRNRAKYWIKEYNNFEMRPLGWMSPIQKLEEFNSKVK
jgi:transposase InsO family protein